MMLGMGFILSVPIYMTWNHYCVYHREAQLIQAFSDMIHLSCAEIQTHLLPLPYLAVKQVEHGPKELKEFWEYILSTPKDHPNLPFTTIWHNALLQLELHTELLQILDRYPTVLEAFDIELIKKEFQHMQDDLAHYNTKKKVKFEREFKVQTGIRFSSALLLIILAL